jgi:outer membrane lipoprotein carrier protein
MPACSLWGAALLLAALTAQPTTADVVARVQERIDATQDLQARVHQKLEMASLGRPVEADGTVAFKKPGMMRWRLDGDEPQVIVADGKTIWFYQVDEGQVLKAPFESAFRSATPVSFLTGVGRIADDFEAEILSHDASRIRLGLRPRRGGGDLGQLRLDVDAQSYEIVAAEVVDSVGNVTQLTFSEQRRNRGLPDSEFHFEVPEGVDVVEAPLGN